VPLGADEIQGDLAELFGHVNRALPDAELNAFVDAPAVRIASFDKQAIAEAKCLDEQVAALIDGRPGISECNAFPDATDPWGRVPSGRIRFAFPAWISSDVGFFLPSPSLSYEWTSE